MLLYAQTINEPENYESAIIAGYEIKIKTLDNLRIDASDYINKGNNAYEK